MLPYVLSPHRLLLLPTRFTFALFLLTLSLSTILGAQTTLPYMDSTRDSAFARLDFAEMYMNQEAWEDAEKTSGQIMDQNLVHSGAVSIFDLQAPRKAIKQFNRGTALLKAQNSKEAIPFLEKAVSIYPEFVSAHIALGLAYFDQRDTRAHDEFRNAATLDAQFPVAFFDLGVTDLFSHDFTTAASNLRKAAALTPNDTRTLAALAFAENESGNYARSIEIAHHVHQLGDRSLANVHYIAASAALNLREISAARDEFNTFLSEAPADPLAPLVRRRLDELQRTQNQNSTHDRSLSASSIEMMQTFPNTARLHTELGSLTTEQDAPDCPNCSTPQPILLSTNSFASEGPRYRLHSSAQPELFTIRKAVDETALFLSVSRKGHVVENLQASDIQILDDNKPPLRILQFTPQSQVPLRLGLLIDTSASVQHRFLFEKHAAEQFLSTVVDARSDLAFVAGFNSGIFVTQDFTGDAAALARGVEKLSAGADGTAVFDAVNFACWKLAAYPDKGRVAKVLVILTDGQDNASHETLLQSIEAAEDAGVTIYTVNTGDDFDVHSDAARILQVIAERSGGDFVFPKVLRDLDRYLSQLPNLIRSRYLIAYKPADFVPNGRYRPLQVSAVKEGKHLQVNVRKGYYARLNDN